MSAMKIAIALAQQLFRQQVEIARTTGLSAIEAARTIAEKLDDLGLNHGFLPDLPIDISHDLKQATATIMFCDYRTEALLTA